MQGFIATLPEAVDEETTRYGDLLEIETCKRA